VHGLDHEKAGKRDISVPAAKYILLKLTLDRYKRSGKAGDILMVIVRGI